MAVPAACRSMPGIAGFSLDRYFTRIALFPTFAVMLCIFGIPLLFSFYLSFTGCASMGQALRSAVDGSPANYEDLLSRSGVRRQPRHHLRLHGGGGGGPDGARPRHRPPAERRPAADPHVPHRAGQCR